MIRRFFRTYIPFAKAGVQETVTYRTNFLFFILGDVLKCFIMYFLWKAVFASSGDGLFKGFNMEDMVLYVFVSFLVSTLTYSGSASVIAEEVRDGSISMRMIKPIKFEMPFLFQELGNSVMKIYLIFIPFLIGVEVYRYVISGVIKFQIQFFLFFIISLIIAYLINFYFNLCYGFTAFIIKNLWGARLLKDCIIGFISGATIPLHFLPATLEKVFSALPFASMSYTPVMIYMGQYSIGHTFKLIGIQIIWLIFFILISKIIWKIVSKHISIQGG